MGLDREYRLYGRLHVILPLQTRILIDEDIDYTARACKLIRFYACGECTHPTRGSGSWRGDCVVRI